MRERRVALEAFYAAEARDGLELTPCTSDHDRAQAWLEQSGGTVGGAAVTDGVVAKRLDDPYRAGERAMLKVKRLRTADCVVGGFRYGEGSTLVASLLLGLYDEAGRLDHVGFTSDLSRQDLPALTAQLEAMVEPPGFTGDAPSGPSRWSTERSARLEAAPARAGGGGPLRPRHRRPHPPRDQVRPLAPRQGCRAVHVRAAGLKGQGSGRPAVCWGRRAGLISPIADGGVRTEGGRGPSGAAGRNVAVASSALPRGPSVGFAATSPSFAQGGWVCSCSSAEAACPTPAVRAL